MGVHQALESGIGITRVAQVLETYWGRVEGCSGVRWCVGGNGCGHCLERRQQRQQRQQRQTNAHECETQHKGRDCFHEIEQMSGWRNVYSKGNADGYVVCVMV